MKKKIHYVKTKTFFTPLKNKMIILLKFQVLDQLNFILKSIN